VKELFTAPCTDTNGFEVPEVARALSSFVGENYWPKEQTYFEAKRRELCPEQVQIPTRAMARELLLVFSFVP